MRGRTFTVTLNPASSVENLKARLTIESGLHPDRQRLIFAGTQLEDGRPLSDYNIGNQSTIFLVEL